MRKGRCTEEQIRTAVSQAEAGVDAAELVLDKQILQGVPGLEVAGQQSSIQEQSGRQPAAASR